MTRSWIGNSLESSVESHTPAAAQMAFSFSEEQHLRPPIVCQTRKGGCLASIHSPCCQSYQHFSVHGSERVGIGRHRCSPAAKIFVVPSLENYNSRSVVERADLEPFVGGRWPSLHRRLTRRTGGRRIGDSLLLQTSHDDSLLDADPTLISTWRPWIA